MIQDIQRGWAWTRALLGLNAEEIHLCGEESAVDLVKSLLADTLDEFEVCSFYLNLLKSAKLMTFYVSTKFKITRCLIFPNMLKYSPL